VVAAVLAVLEGGPVVVLVVALVALVTLEHLVQACSSPSR
jgi:hypothetical protein